MDGLLTRGRAAALDHALSVDLAAPAPSHDVAAELAVVHRLRETGAALDAAPSPEFRAALRTRLMAVAAVQGVGQHAPSAAPAAVSWRARAATVTAGVMATVVAAGGVAVASSRALPGDPFYGVKRTTEAVQLKVAGDHQAEGTRHLQFAATRLREVRALVLGRGAPADAVATGTVRPDVEGDVRRALDDMDVDTRTGLQLLTSSFRASRATDPLEDLSRFAVQQGAGLRGVLPALTGETRAQAQESLRLLEGVRAEADELLVLVDCTAVCDPAQVAPSVPEPGLPASSCGCSTTVPAPQTAPPPPPSPAGGPAEPAQPTEPAPTSPQRPGATPQPADPPPSEPEPGPTLPGLPVPSLPPVPTLPPVAPLGPDGPTVELPSLDRLLPGLAPAVLPGGGLRVLLSWIAER